MRRRRPNPYVVLGLPREASAEEITRAYRRAARASHPDSAAAGSTDRFQAVSDAYDELRDPERRAVFDRSHPPTPPEREVARTTVRYAGPGSQHIVLGAGLNASAGGLLLFSTRPFIDWRCEDGEPADP